MEPEEVPSGIGVSLQGSREQVWGEALGGGAAGPFLSLPPSSSQTHMDGDKQLRGEDRARTEPPSIALWPSPSLYSPHPILRSQNTGAPGIPVGMVVLHSNGGSPCGGQGQGLSLRGKGGRGASIELASSGHNLVHVVQPSIPEVRAAMEMRLPASIKVGPLGSCPVKVAVVPGLGFPGGTSVISFSAWHWNQFNVWVSGQEKLAG